MKKVLAIWLVTLAYLIGIGSVLIILPFSAIIRAYIGDAILVVAFFLWNHFVFKQKILIEKYPFWKGFGLLGYSWLVLIATFTFFFAEKLPASNIIIALGAIVVGIAEEFIFRGLIFGHLVAKSKSIIFPLLFSSFLFACAHGINIFHQPLLNTVIQVLYVFPMGVFLAILYLKSNNLIIPIIMHFIQDFSSFLISSGSVSSSLTNLFQVVEIYVIFGTLSALFLVFGSKQVNLFKERIRGN